MKCEYAACNQEAPHQAECWWFCTLHLREHYGMRREESRANKPRRCWWCGAWALGTADCDACTSPAARPPSIRKDTA